MQHTSPEAKGELLMQGNGFDNWIPANIPMHKEVMLLPGLENW